MSDKPIRVWVVDGNPGNVSRFREALHGAGLNSELLAMRDGVEALVNPARRNVGRRLGTRSCSPGGDAPKECAGGDHKPADFAA